jgi:hypothetical protein
MIACFCCHLGWTDIINSLALIHYYKDQYDLIYVLMREDAGEMLQYFIKDVPNIVPLYFPIDVLSVSVYGIYQHLTQRINENSPSPIPVYPLLIGLHDKDRNDQYQGAFLKSSDHFCDRFYTCYDLSPNTRYEHFVFSRNKEIEMIKYQQIVQNKPYKEGYILINDTPENPIDTLIRGEDCISLTNVSNCFFDCIMLLENAKEIHAIDTIWACFCFLIDMKYQILKNKGVKVIVYCKRGYREFFKGYETLENWTLV